MVFALVGGGAGLLVTVIALAVGWRRATNRLPTGVVHHLAKPGARHRVRLRGLMAGTQGTWNPAKPWGSANFLYGPGRGTYWLDGGQVHLDWQPERGEQQHFVGPIPAAADPNSPAKRRARRARRVVFSAYLLFAAVGFVLGFSLASGNSWHRAAIAAFGAAGGYFFAYVVLLTVVGSIRVRRGGRGKAD